MNELQCLGIDELLCDYVDGTLSADQKSAFEAHTQSCPACAELVSDVVGSVHFMERAATVEAPKELLTRILNQTPKHAPLVDAISRIGWARRFMAPLLQPRFAMGMAMTILSFSMLGKFVAPVRQLKASDLEPAKVWRSVDDSAHRTWNRFVKYYDNLRLVYEVQTAIDDIKGDTDDQPGSPKSNTKKSGESK
ncbi:anti-sigma factor family protein [Bryobacter aggregatus]|uniref:anti-sigma factor family protein n=1 Tax=Bryobacter aggregatus TaxID=360054 RepID=UPI0004E0E940|nr:zf-HC2 domain-containing protein [Bryobacter aggregatus]